MVNKYIIQIRFNCDMEVSQRCHIECLSEAWIRERIGIFNQYTRKSLEKQINQDFLAILLTNEKSMGIINSILEEYPPLPPNIQFTAHKNQVIESYIKGADKVYISSLDSDDMYDIKFIQYLHDYRAKENEQLLIFNTGYVYNAVMDIMIPYQNVSPPFYTQIFKVEEYLKCYRYYKMIRHFYMQDMPHTIINMPMFLLILHNTNSYQYYRRDFPKAFDLSYQIKSIKTVKLLFGLGEND